MTEVTKVLPGFTGGSSESQIDQPISENGSLKGRMIQEIQHSSKIDTSAIFQNSHSTLDDSKLQNEEHDFQSSDDFNKNHSSESEKIGSAATVVVSSTKMLQEIKDMSEDQLEEAYMEACSDPISRYKDFKKEIGEEWQKKMLEGQENDEQFIDENEHAIDEKEHAIEEKEHIVEETQQEKSELVDIQETESKLEQTENTQATNVEGKANTKATEVQEVGEKMASSIEKKAKVVTEDGKLHLPGKASGPVKCIVSFDETTGVLSGSKANLKNYKKGQEIEVETEFGFEKVVITKLNELSKEEDDRLQEYVSSNFQISTPTVGREESNHKTDEKSPLQTTYKPRESTDISKQEALKVDSFQKNTEQVILNSVTATDLSSAEKATKRFEKYEEKLDELERQISDDIEKHENFVENATRQEESTRIEKSSIKLEELHAEIYKLDDKNKDIIHTVQNDNRIPLATKQKVKAIITQCKILEKKVYDSGMDINRKEKYTEQVFEIKKDCIELCKEVLKENGIQATKGTDIGGKTEA